MNINDVMVGGKVELADGTVDRVDAVAHGWVTLAGTTQKYRASALWPVGTTDEQAEAEAAAAEVEEEEVQRDTPVLHFDLTHYASGLAKTASGRKTIDTNDAVATRLRGKTIEECYGIAADFIRRYAAGDEKPPTAADLQERYGHLNAGMQRMNLGNKMRGAFGRHMDREAARAAADGRL